jgi:hypothetical protein
MAQVVDGVENMEFKRRGYEQPPLLSGSVGVEGDISSSNVDPF